MFLKKPLIFVDCENEAQKLKQSELSWHFDLIFCTSSDHQKLERELQGKSVPFVVINCVERLTDLVDHLKSLSPNTFYIGKTDLRVEEDLVPVISSGIDFLVPAHASARIIFSVIASRIMVIEKTEVNLLTIENLEINKSNRSVLLSGKSIRLSDLEIRLLVLFVKNKDKILKREFILSEVWGRTDVTSRTIDSHIVGLRKKLDGFTLNFDSIYGVGYILRGSE